MLYELEKCIPQNFMSDYVQSAELTLRFLSRKIVCGLLRKIYSRYFMTHDTCHSILQLGYLRATNTSAASKRLDFFFAFRWRRAVFCYYFYFNSRPRHCALEYELKILHCIGGGVNSMRAIQLAQSSTGRVCVYTRPVLDCTNWSAQWSGVRIEFILTLSNLASTFLLTLPL